MLTARMAAVPARHTQVTSGQFTFSEVLARAKRKRPAANSGTKSASTTLGVEFGACLGAVLPFGPENTMNYTAALGARADTFDHFSNWAVARQSSCRHGRRCMGSPSCTCPSFPAR